MIERVVASAADVGSAVRETRQAAAVTQRELADLVGTTRQWIIRLERGHHSLTMSTVLVALSVLGLEMVAEFDPPPRPAPRPGAGPTAP